MLRKTLWNQFSLPLEPGGQYVEDEPHEGEEFGYVLSGSIILHLG